MTGSAYRVLIIDPQFADRADVEREVFGPDVDIDVWRPVGSEEVPHDRLAEVEAVINCRSRHVIRGPTVAAMHKARIVAQSGVGFNHIDLAACAARGIPVCNTPDYGTMEVADHAVALALSLARGVVAYHMRLLVRDDAWGTLALPLPPVKRLKGRTFGVVGLGRIGLAAALRARAFELGVAFYDPYLPPGAELALGFTRAPTLHALMAMSDIVSVHCPLNEETAKLIDDAALAAMPPGGLLVNTSRGGVVDLDAVERALKRDHLAAAGLDVLPIEPLNRSHPLIAAWTRQEKWLEGRLTLTPHAAFYTPESVRDMRRLSATAVHEYMTRGSLRACVNADLLRAAGHKA